MNKQHYPQPKVRNSNLELYRILLMLAIVAHHYVINSGLKDLMDSDPFAPRSLFLYIIGMWGKVGINCFVLITGYFMCKSEITLWKFLKLVLEILFYNFAINLSFVIIGVIDFSLRDFLWRLSPVHGIRRDFVSCYFFFFLLIPFLNILVRNMKQQQHKLLLSLILCMYTVLSVFPGFPLEVNYVTWFCVIFLIGSYLRLYPYKESNTLFWIIAFVTSVIMTITSIFPLLYVKRFGLDLGAYYLVIDSNKPLALFVSICAFMLFKNMKIKQSKFINTVGGALLVSF